MGAYIKFIKAMVSADYSPQLCKIMPEILNLIFKGVSF